jgi:hypothetical protein
MNSSKKRMAKAIERTLRWFDEQITSVKGVNGHGDGSSCSDDKDHSGNSNKDHSSDTDRIGIDEDGIAFFGVAQYNPNYPVQITDVVRNIILKGATGDLVYDVQLYVIYDSQ